MTGPALRLGTRRSPLAVAQATGIAQALRARGVSVDLVEIVTEGDTSSAALTEIGGTGVFASALRTALRQERIDLAVHSLKDLPTAPEPGLALAAVPRREDVRDALVARDGLTLGELPAGAAVGTGSPRRAAQLAALGLGLRVVPIRGNVETRLAKVTAGELDAVVLARAGLSRLGLTGVITENLDPIQMLPAAGQGALALECRAADAATAALLAPLEDPDTRACVTAERAVLTALEAGCVAPVGVLAEVVEGMDGPELSVRGFVGTTDGAFDLRRSVTGPHTEPERVGVALARLLLADGAHALPPRPDATTTRPGWRDPGRSAEPAPAPTVHTPSRESIP